MAESSPHQHPHTHFRLLFIVLSNMPTPSSITPLLFSFIFIMRKPPHISHPEFSPLRHVVSPTFHPDASHHEFCPANVLPYPDVSQPQFCPADIPLSPDILQPQFYPAGVPPSPDISHPAPTAGWERGTIQLPRTYMFGSSSSAYPENFCSRQFRFPRQLGSSDTRDSPDPFPPTIKKITLTILTTKSPELSLIFNARYIRQDIPKSSQVS